MSNFQYVTLVAVNGTPIRLADQSGAPFPTTGSGPLVFANGATMNNLTLTGVLPSPLTTRGDLYYYGASGNTRLPLGATGLVLGSNGTDAVWVAAGAGTVSSVATGTGLTGGPITTTGTIALANTAVTPNSYGDATHVATLTVDQQGRLTAAASVAVTPAASSLTGLGTGVATALAVNVGTAGAFVVLNGAGGTPSSIGLANGTGLPIAGISGLGTGVATALAVNTGTNGSHVVQGGALGTPSSGTGTNLTGIPAAAILAGLLASGMTATTQAAGDNTTNLATTAFALLTAGKVKIQVFDIGGGSTQTYTPSAGMVNALGFSWGGGGGGGGAVAAGTASTATTGGSGGAGSLSIKLMTAAAVGASKTVTLGAAGTAGASGNNAGGAGGDTSIGSLCIGKGGSGGAGAPNTGNNSSLGGLGGVAGTGDITTTGQPGGSGYGPAVGAGGFTSPPGGSSLVGGGALPVGGNTTSIAGNAGTGRASGGGGGYGVNGSSNVAGGAGTAGHCFIIEFCNQ